MLGLGRCLLGVTSILALLPSCETKQCTEIGCGDAATVTLRTADGALPDGAYTFRFTEDGQTSVCELRVPDDLPSSPGQVRTTPCTGQLELDLTPESTCTERRSGDSVSQSCTPVPGKFSLGARLASMPSSLTVIVERDGVEIANEQRNLVYQDYYPNGPECGPPCKQTNVAVALGD